MVEFLIKVGVDIEVENSFGIRPIHLICDSIEILSNHLYPHIEPKNRLVKILTSLINAGANLEAMDKDGNRAIHFICRSINVIALKLLLKENVNLHCVNSKGMQPIHFACEYSNSRIVTILLKASVDTECRDHLGRTPIFYAVSNDLYGKKITSCLSKIVNLDVIDSFMKKPIDYATDETRLILNDILNDKNNENN